MKNKALHHQDQLIPYQIQHKLVVKRRIHLRTTPEGSLLVIAPQRMSKRAIHKALQERVHKVAQFLAGALKRLQELPRYDYINGEEHLYLGRKHPLEIMPLEGSYRSVGLCNGRIRINTRNGSPEGVKKNLISWYRQQAQQHFSTRISAISKTAAWTSGKPPPMRLRKMKRSWGSCSAKGQQSDLQCRKRCSLPQPILGGRQQGVRLRERCCETPPLRFRPKGHSCRSAVKKPLLPPAQVPGSQPAESHRQ